jgi:diguanylate cyclase (GGDEF)-like protein
MDFGVTGDAAGDQATAQIGRGGTALAMAVLQALPQGVVVFDGDVRLRLWNRRLLALLEFGSGRLGRRPSMDQLLAGAGRLDVRARRAVAESCAAVVASDPARPCPDPVRLHAGEGRALLLHIRRIGDRRWCAAFEDFARRPQAPVAPVAFRDPLTGLPGSDVLHTILSDMLGTAPGGARGPGLLFIDVQPVEPSGGPVDDGLLRLVAQRLSGALRETDLPARPSRDLFAVVLPDGEGAEPLARRLLGVLGRSYGWQGQRTSLAASIGIARAPRDGADADTLVGNAGLALAQARAEGRGIIRCFEPAPAEALNSAI